MIIKRGQISIFIILAFIILGIFLILIMSTGTNEELIEDEGRADLITEKESIKSYVKECLREKLEDAVFYDSLQGGYLGIVPNSISFESGGIDLAIPIYYYRGDMLIPEIERIKNEIKFGFNLGILECMDFSPIKNGAELDLKGKAETEINILKDKITAKTDIPFLVHIKESSFVLGSFYIEAPSDLLNLYETARIITTKQEGSQNKVCISCMPRWMEQREVNIYANEYFDGQSYMILYDIQSKKDNSYFNFVHALEYGDTA